MSTLLYYEGEEMEQEELKQGLQVIWERKSSSHWGEVVSFDDIPAVILSWSDKRVRIETRDQDGNPKRVSVKRE